MENKYLPIGSVVKISDSQKKLMITGYLPIETNENEERKITDDLHEACGFRTD